MIDLVVGDEGAHLDFADGSFADSVVGAAEEGAEVGEIAEREAAVGRGWDMVLVYKLTLAKRKKNSALS